MTVVSPIGFIFIHQNLIFHQRIIVSKLNLNLLWNKRSVEWIALSKLSFISDGRKFDAKQVIFHIWRKKLSVAAHLSLKIHRVLQWLFYVKASRELEMIIRWSVGFVMDTTFLDESSKKLLNLCAQEITCNSSIPWCNNWRRIFASISDTLK